MRCLRRHALRRSRGHHVCNRCRQPTVIVTQPSGVGRVGVDGGEDSVELVVDEVAMSGALDAAHGWDPGIRGEVQ